MKNKNTVNKNEIQILSHRIEALAHEHTNGHNAADQVEAKNPALARDYRAAANEAKAKQTALKAELKKLYDAR